jgi:hypothetical protein
VAAAGAAGCAIDDAGNGVDAAAAAVSDSQPLVDVFDVASLAVRVAARLREGGLAVNIFAGAIA